MPLLIDAYNVLHVTGVLPPELAGVDVHGLARLIESSRYRSEDVCLVCDGLLRGSGSGGRDRPDGPEAATRAIRVVYAGAGKTADDLIIRLIHKSSTPRRLTVVSSDRQIRQAATRRRCRVLTADEFLAQIARDHAMRGRGAPKRGGPTKPPGLLPEGHVDRWIEQFGLSEADLARPAADPLPGEAGKDEVTLDNVDEIDMKRILGEGDRPRP